MRTNVAAAAEVKALVDTTVERYGRIDVAFNNAGVLPPTKPLIEMEESDWDKTINIDLKGVWLSMKYEIPQMLKTGGGAIMNTASVAGPDRGSAKEAKVGVLQEGAWADMLLVNGDPLKDINVLKDYERNFLLIIKDGKIYKNISN